MLFLFIRSQSGILNYKAGDVISWFSLAPFLTVCLVISTVKQRSAVFWNKRRKLDLLKNDAV